MGSSFSKDIRNAVEVIEEESKKSPTSPSYKVIRCDDPRSPIAELARTPIEVFSKKCSPSVPIRKCYSEEDLTPLRSQNLPASVHVIDDPRSPTLGINRTPIHVDSSAQPDLSTNLCFVETNIDKIFHQTERNVLDSSLHVSIDNNNESPTSSSAPSEPSNDALLDTSDDSISSAPYTILFKTLSKFRASPGPYVYEDVADSTKEALKDKKESRNRDWNNSSEKENDAYKRKLFFTPETKTGFKVRTPLGSRCNYQDSPSQVLKMKQVQKVDQEMEYDVSTFGSSEKSLKLKKQQHQIDWDNKDSTLIL